MESLLYRRCENTWTINPNQVENFTKKETNKASERTLCYPSHRNRTAYFLSTPSVNILNRYWLRDKAEFLQRSTCTRWHAGAWGKSDVNRNVEREIWGKNVEELLIICRMYISLFRRGLVRVYIIECTFACWYMYLIKLSLAEGFLAHAVRKIRLCDFSFAARIEKDREKESERGTLRRPAKLNLFLCSLFPSRSC